LREEYANPEIQLEITLDRILSFLITHLDCKTSKQIFHHNVSISTGRELEKNRKSKK
jgi:hypothetical protein